MNAQAAAVEHGMGRAVMSSFHGLFSLGGVVGAVLAGGAMLAGANDAQHVAAATTGYLGFLAGPPLIGAVAEVVGLTVGLALVSAACALIAARGGPVAAFGAGDCTRRGVSAQQLGVVRIRADQPGAVGGHEHLVLQLDAEGRAGLARIALQAEDHVLLDLALGHDAARAAIVVG